MNTPPPPQRKSAAKGRRLLIIIGTAVVLLAIGAFFLIRSIIASGVTSGFDNMFGDQHLKTSVALLELHKVRYGKYPASLRDLKFTGQWDQIALQSIRYYPSQDGTHYYIEVERGWVAKPTFVMPPEFWQGTGYSASLKPTSP